MTDRSVGTWDENARPALHVRDCQWTRRSDVYVHWWLGFGDRWMEIEWTRIEVVKWDLLQVV